MINEDVRLNHECGGSPAQSPSVKTETGFRSCREVVARFEEDES